MKLRLKSPLLMMVIVVSLFAVPTSQGLAQGPDAATRGNNAYFNTFASCGNSKPFKPAKRCRYDSSRKFRGTFVFRSKIGKVILKACFRIKGRAPLGGGHGCAKVGPLTVKNYPFRIAGVRQRFGVKFNWYVKKPGAKGGFGKAASAYLKVRP